MKLALVAASLLVAATRLAGAAPAPWCGKSESRSFEYDLTKDDGSFRYASDVDDVDSDAFASVVNALCSPRTDSDVTKFHAQLEAARARWGKRLAMTEADWADAAAYAARPVSERRIAGLDLDLAHRPWSDFTPVEQYEALHRGSSFGGVHIDPTYVADAFGARLSEAGRLAYIIGCIESPDPDPVHWAACQADIDAFDLTKLAAELRADTKHTGIQRMTIRLAADTMRRALLPRHDAALAKLQKDPATAALFQLAAAARKDWDTQANRSASLIALLGSMEDLTFTGAPAAKFEGCVDKTRAAFQAAMTAVPAKDFAALPKISGDDDDTHPIRARIAAMALRHVDVYLAAAALVECTAHVKTARNAVISDMGTEMRSNPGLRGPRNAALAAIAHAGTERKVEIERLWFDEGSTGTSRAGTGMVGTLSPKAGKVHLEFKGTTYMVDGCTKWEKTKKILTVTAGGEIIYVENCVASKSFPKTTAGPPWDLDAKIGAMLRPGMLVVLADGIPVIAWTSGTAKAPAIVLGAPVK